MVALTGMIDVGPTPLVRPHYRAPLYLAWEVTLRCNARCLHCYSDSGPGVRHPGEMDTERALRVIDQLADAGLLVLAFSGGEPLIRRDIFQLIDHAVARGLVVNVATNGAIVRPRIAQRLKSAGVRSVTVSLDGGTPETHDHIRQFPGLFRRSTRAIELLAAQGLRVVVSFTPTRLNYREGADVVHLAAASGAMGANLSEFVPAGRGTHDLALAPEQLRAVLHEWIALREQYAGRMDVIWHDCRVASLVPPEERNLYSGCGAGTLTARLRVDGTLTPCVFIPTSAGNLKDASFVELWENAPLFRQIRNRATIVSGNCGDCPLKPVCGGCRAVSLSYYGDLTSGDPFCWIRPEAFPTAAQNTLVHPGGPPCPA